MVLTVWQNLYLQSIYQARTSVVQQQDQALAAQLQRDILHHLPPHVPQPVRLDFGGLKRPALIYPEVFSTTGGYSFFEWDQGHPERMVRYLNLLGYGPYQHVYVHEHEALKQVYRTMPTWPAEGSIRIIDDIIAVKLSDDLD